MSNIKQKEERYFMNTYKRNDLIIKKAKNQYIWDENDNKYLDFTSGISVCNLGHCNENIIEAIKKQLNNLMHVSNLYYTEVQLKFGELLVKKTETILNDNKVNVFLSNSGAEANECAIKLARKWGGLNPSKLGNRYEIICFKNSFHGRTMATLSATGQEKFHNYFKPLQPKFLFADINNINSVTNHLNNNTVAIMIEPIQGEGGVVTASFKFLQELRKVCDENNLLLIFDEIQCGMGRTGTFYAFEHSKVNPDIITLAKGLANGLPLGATLANSRCYDSFTYGDHGSTFGGNPVSCAAAIAVLREMNESNFLYNVNKTASYLYKKLKILMDKYSIITEIRGLGLLLGIKLSISGIEIVKFCLKNGLLVTCTQDTVIRLLPPLIVTEKDIDLSIKILENALKWKMTQT
ncbi:MAG: aspartate aminotransferase family protein [Endomicrobium sp.]|jgi:predicted acetylornithine/succinylornithine family transaminase|nr:aspartate aminotransferase family protein [Endomicrobium sp.]